MTFDKVYQYNFPTTIRFGPGAANELGDYLLKNGWKKPLVVTDPTVSQLEFFRKICRNLAEKSISVEVFQDIHKNPVKSDVYKGSDAFDGTQRDCIVGIGGGERWIRSADLRHPRSAAGLRRAALSRAGRPRGRAELGRAASRSGDGLKSG